MDGKWSECLDSLGVCQSMMLRWVGNVNFGTAHLLERKCFCVHRKKKDHAKREKKKTLQLTLKYMFWFLGVERFVLDVSPRMMCGFPLNHCWVDC